MNQHQTVIEVYRGFEIIHNLCGFSRTDFYMITGSAMAIASVEAARRVIDTYLKATTPALVPGINNVTQ